MIQFLEETHQYLLDDLEFIPSVTTILKDDTYDKVPPYILEKAAAKGTAVHYCTELIDKGEKPIIDDEYAMFVVQYLLQKIAHPIEWTDIEVIVYTKEYAGTVDRICLNYKGKILIADVKTTYSLHKKKVAKQLGGYVKAHAEMNGNNIEDYIGAVIWLHKDMWKFMEIEPDVKGFEEKLQEYYDKQNTEVTF